MFSNSWAIGVPYLIPDAIKIVLACLISERLRAALHL